MAKEDFSYNHKPYLQNHKLFNLLLKRELMQFKKLGKVLSGTNKDTMFETWMNEESDLIQSCGKSFGERFCAETTIDLIEKTKETDPATAEVLNLLLEQYICDIIEKDAGTFLSNLSLISSEEYQEIQGQSRQLAQDLADHALNIVEAFGLSDDLLSAPIANDWSEFNARDNRGEVDEKVDINY